MMRTWVFLGVLLGCGGAHAQTIDVFDEDAIAQAPSAWTPFADLRVRSDLVRGLPGGRADLHRTRWRARAGATWSRDARLALAFGVRAAVGDDANRDNARNNDNERSNGVDIDQAMLTWSPDATTHWQVGKGPLPFELTPIAWDDDLRPVGVAWTGERDAPEFGRWRWRIGAFDVAHPLSSAGPRMVAVQGARHWREGARVGGALGATYLAFSRTGSLVRDGLARGNPVAGGYLQDEYRLLILHGALVGRETSGASWDARADLLRNVGADANADGARIEVRATPSQAMDWRFGVAWQRLQAASALGAVNGDDWWFHAGVRGVGANAAWTITPRWTLRIAAFRETRDGLARPTRRTLVDLEGRW